MLNKKSVWIKGFNDVYKIFVDGTIVSYKQDKVNGKILKHKKTGPLGYATVDLIKNGKHDYRYVHKLIAESFKHNPHPKKFTIVAHKDGDVSNNALSNLFWTNVEGKLERQNINRKKTLKSNNMFSSKLSDADVDIIAHFVVNKKGVKKLSQIHTLFGVSNMTIHRLKKTRRFKQSVLRLENEV